MKVVTVYPKRMQVPDGEACDECPSTVGRGGRYVRVSDEHGSRVMRLCASDVTAQRRSADHVIREV